MADEEKTTQNPIPEENPLPTSPQEPMAEIPFPTIDSTPTDMLPEVLESPRNSDNAVPVNNANAQNEPISTSNPEIANLIEPQPEADPPLAETPDIKPIPEPTQSPEPVDSTSSPQATAQMAGNEPLKSESEPVSEPALTKAETLSPPVNSGEASEANPELEKIIPVVVPVIVSNKNKIFELLTKAKNAIQFKKRKKLMIWHIKLGLK